MAQGARLLPRRTNPQQFARVNWAHPMARGLSCFLLTAANRSLYSATTGQSAGSGSGQSVVATSEGNACRFNGTARTSSTDVLIGNNTGAAYDSRFVTVIARLRLTTKAASTSIAINLGNSAGSRGVGVGFNSSGNAQASEAGSNGQNNANAKVADSTDWLNTWVTVAGSNAYADLGTPAAGGAHKARLWVNGVRIGDATGTGSASNSGSTPTVFLGRQMNGNYDSFYTGDIAWAAMFPRFLSDSEHAWWHRNAFEVLEQQSNPSFFSLPSEAAAAFMARQGLNIPQAVNRASTF